MRRTAGGPEPGGGGGGRHPKKSLPGWAEAGGAAGRSLCVNKTEFGGGITQCQTRTP